MNINVYREYFGLIHYPMSIKIFKNSRSAQYKSLSLSPQSSTQDHLSGLVQVYKCTSKLCNLIQSIPI